MLKLRFLVDTKRVRAFDPQDEFFGDHFENQTCNISKPISCTQDIRKADHHPSPRVVSL